MPEQFWQDLRLTLQAIVQKLRPLHTHSIDSGADAWSEEAPVLSGLAAASVQGTVALGPHRGARLRRLGTPPESIEASPPGGCHARANGFDLHAGLVVPAGQRERLERVASAGRR